jgi:hypothetical protein
MIDPRDAEIPETVLDLVPQKIIHECTILPLRDDGKRLTLFCCRDSDFGRESDRLAFIFDREIDWLPVDANLLQQAIEQRYPRGNPEIRGCLPQFRFQCPQHWLALQPTSDKRIRFCSECQRDVHWCDDNESACSLGREGKCVALSEDGDAETIGMIEFEY